MDCRCPCCRNPGIQEDTIHQIHCPNKDRIRLWLEDCGKLSEWLENNQNMLVLKEEIIKYVKGRGCRRFFQGDMSSEARALGDTQDTIGWDNFMEGKVSNEIRKCQKQFLIQEGSRKSSITWTAGLISQLLGMVHEQWTYRNGVVHKRDEDGLNRLQKAELSIRIRAQLGQGSSGLEEEDKFLLSPDYKEICKWEKHKKLAWLREIITAR